MKLISRLLACCFLLTPLFTQADQSIRISAGDWPPYISEQLPHYGITSRIVQEAFALEGITVELEFYPWSRSLELARSGQVQATLGWAITEERKQDFRFSQQPINTEQTVFFFHRDRPIDWQGIWQQNTPQQHRVGATLGYEYGERFDTSEANQHFHLKHYPDDKDGFLMLLKKQIDFFPVDLVVAHHILRQHYPLQRQQFDYVRKPLHFVELYLLFSKKDPASQQLKLKFDQGMKKLKNKGRLNTLHSKCNQEKTRHCDSANEEQ